MNTNYLFEVSSNMIIIIIELIQRFKSMQSITPEIVSLPLMTDVSLNIGRLVKYSSRRLIQYYHNLYSRAHQEDVDQKARRFESGQKYGPIVS